MTDPGLRGRFLRLTAINIASNVTVPLTGLVDTAMLGHLDDIRFLAGVALGAVLFDYVYWSFGFLRMGTTGTAAQATGRGDTGEVYATLHRALFLAACIAALLLALKVPIARLGFLALSGEPAVEAAGRAYFDARIWGAPATLANFALVGWFLGREQVRTVLALTVVANVTNIVLDWWWILHLGLAATGAGLATACSQYAMLAVGIALVLRQTDRHPWSSAAVFDRPRLVALFRLNADILVRTLGLITAFAVFANFSAILGTAVLAANTLLLRILSVASYAIDGAAFAVETLAGTMLGQRNDGGLRRLHRMSLIAGEAFAIPLVAIVVAFPGAVFGVLTSHDAVVRDAAALAPWLVPVIGIGAIAYVYDGLFLGLTEGRRLRNSMLASAVVVFLPLAWAARALDSNTLLWGALTAFMAARVATLGGIWLRESRRTMFGTRATATVR